MLFIQSVFLLLTLLICSLVGITIWLDNKAHLFEQQQGLNHQLVQSLDQELINRRMTLEGLAKLMVNQDGLLNLDRLQTLLDTRIKLHDYFNAGLGVLDLEGNIIVDSPIIPGRVGLNVADRPHVKQVMQTHESYITPPFVGRAVKEPVFHVYVPIFDSTNKVVGYVFGVTLLEKDNFLLDLSQRVMGEGYEFYVIDLEKELVVTSSRRDLVLKPLEKHETIPVLEKVKKGQLTGISPSIYGDRVLYTAQSSSLINWMILHTLEESMVFEPVWALLWKLILALLLLMLFVVAVTVGFIRNQLKPLDIAAHQANKMIDNDALTDRFTVQCQDELGLLLNSFNRVLDKNQVIVQQLAEAKFQSDEANRAKSEFLANMSHEIRTPLNAVLGLTEVVLNDANLPDTPKRRIQQVNASGKLLLGIINDVLDYSKIESGKLEIDQTEFNLNDILEQLSVMFAEQAARKGIELVFHVRPNVPTRFIGDKLRLTQVLTNLMSNALKFTEKGEVELCIRNRPATDNKSGLLIAIRDTGIGMTEVQRQRLFKAFMQADTSITRKHGGTGLGLVISQRLLHLMGASDIHVDSIPDKGSVFSFDISLTAVNSKDNANHQFSCDPLPCHALVVDDQPISRMILREILESWKIQVDEAENGDQAIDNVKQHLEDGQFYKVILMDWEMPHRNGLDALREISLFWTQCSNTFSASFKLSTI
jgi:signal transduction histidine kinase